MKKNLNEFLCALYLFVFTICKFLTIYFVNYSTVILFVATFIIVLISLLYNIKLKKKKLLINKNFIAVIVIVVLLFLMTMIHNNNIYTEEYLYEFFIYGVISMYLFINIKNYREFLKYYANLSILVILIYCLEPFNDFQFFIDYMSFGLTCMLPAFCGCCIGRKILKKNIYLVFEIVAFMEILFFCNRGAILVAVALEVLLYLIMTKLNIKKIAICLLCTSIGFILLINIEKILLTIFKYLQSKDIYSYSIRSMYNMFSGVSNGLSGRDKIWKNAIEYFQESFIWGNGIGSFQNKYGIYTHNIFLEILTSYGVIGMFVFLTLSSIYVYKIHKSIGDYKVILIMFMVMGIFPLMLSIYTFKWQYFWIFIIMSLKKIPEEYKRKNKIIEKTENLLSN